MLIKMANRQVLNVLNNQLSILIVSANMELMTRLKASIFVTLKSDPANHPYDCQIHLTSELTTVTERSTNPVNFFDFYIFVIEPKFLSCLNQLEEQLKNLKEKCGRQKICLVAVDVDYSKSVKPDQLWKFAQIYQVNLLIGDLKTTAKAEHLVNRILNLCEACCGLNNGIPLVGKI